MAEALEKGRGQDTGFNRFPGQLQRVRRNLGAQVVDAGTANINTRLREEQLLTVDTDALHDWGDFDLEFFGSPFSPLALRTSLDRRKGFDEGGLMNAAAISIGDSLLLETVDARVPASADGMAIALAAFGIDSPALFR